MKKEKLLISACLLGIDTKYNGGNNLLADLKRLYENFDLYPICPEVIGGLSIPRRPSEILHDKVISDLGVDVTENFENGANAVLDIAKKYGITKALLKERSPSCGVKQIYDGTFANKLINGSGITARLLKEAGIELYTEEELEKLLPKK